MKVQMVVKIERLMYGWNDCRGHDMSKIDGIVVNSIKL